MERPRITCRPLSSLTKVFADEPLSASPVEEGTALENEVYSFQVAYHSPSLVSELRPRVESDLADIVTVRAVGLAPCELPWREEHDDDVVRTTPGLYPDPLHPIEVESGVVAPPEQWRALWVTVDLSLPAGPDAGTDSRPGASAGSGEGSGDCEDPRPPVDRSIGDGQRSDGQRRVGEHPIRVVLESANGEPLAICNHLLRVIPARLPPQELVCTQWFHADCLATYYRTGVFSEEHWALIEAYVADAVKHGVTMILTPLFTPPLDTAVGGERPTVQLVDVSIADTAEGPAYTFGFSRLTRWIDLCDRAGVGYFEFSHLFTQWGAEFCPKIIADDGAQARRIFGWDTPSTGEAYRRFLGQFLPALVAYIDERGIADRVYFHISDEPRIEQLEQYRAVRAIVEPHLSRFPVMDALSSYAFYETGAVDLPVPASNHIAPFIEGEVKPLWTYYCVSQRIGVSNRFFAMPSARNRVLGVQLYVYDVAGFLHWGFNFWYSQYSRKPIDPFRVTDAGQAFPSGDAFLVYPGEGEPIDSIRFEVLREAFQDLRALRLLELRIGRRGVIELLHEGVDEPITFDCYPRSQEWILSVRRRVNERLAAT